MAMKTPMALLLALLLASTSALPVSTTPEQILSQCVQDCECYEVRHKHFAQLVVECSDLPPIVPDGTTLLRVTDSRVPALRAQLHELRGLRGLRDFECARCGLAEVAVDAFHALPKLRNIDLSGNAIAALSAAHFSHQSHLELLDVTGNEELDCDAFRREMAAASPGTCVWCGDFVGPCVKTTRGTVASSVAPERPDTERWTPTDYVHPPTPSPVTGGAVTDGPGTDEPMPPPEPTSRALGGAGYLLVVAAASLVGGALGAGLALAALYVVRRWQDARDEKTRGPPLIQDGREVGGDFNINNVK